MGRLSGELTCGRVIVIVIVIVIDILAYFIMKRTNYIFSLFRHAGVSLTVTSVTDVAAFAIGAVTVRSVVLMLLLLLLLLLLLCQ